MNKNNINEIKLNKLYPGGIVNELSQSVENLSAGDIKLINDAKDFIDNIRSTYNSSYNKC